MVLLEHEIMRTASLAAALLKHESNKDEAAAMKELTAIVERDIPVLQKTIDRLVSCNYPPNAIRARE